MPNRRPSLIGLAAASTRRSRTVRRAGVYAAVALGSSLVAGCARTVPAALPTIGGASPVTASAASSPASPQGPRLRAKYQLSGMELPADWPDVPAPRGTRVVSAYGIGEEPNRTWSASFVGSASAGANKLAKPVVAALKANGFQPISEYLDPSDSSSGLYSLRSTNLAVYLMLGELDGHPNIVMTVHERGNTLN